MNTLFCDSHAHLTSSAIYDDIDNVVARALQAGLKQIVNICMDDTSLERGLQLVKRYPWIANAAAVHPHDAEKEGEVFFPSVQTQAHAGTLCAIGETGLDYHYTHSTKEIQKDFLRKHLQLALDTRLPVIIHCREAFKDFFSIVDETYVNSPGVLHCFTGTLTEAEQVLKRGFYISFSGIVTFKKSEELREVIKMAPLDRILVETDAPYLAPQSKRGKPNEPAFVTETLGCLAKIKGLSTPEMAAVTYHNMNALFSLSN